MKISKAIAELKKIESSHGDIEINLNTDQAYRDFDGSFIPLESVVVETVGEVKDEDSPVEKKNIVVLTFPDVFVMEHEL